ncbi:MAG: hypothetical protein AAGI70_11785 [Pseudomonadota bacterium]
MRPQKHPNLLVYVALGVMEGVLAGLVLLLAMLLLDTLGLASLIERSADGPLALRLLAGFFAITFGMLGLAWRVMVLLPDEE